MNVNQMIEKVLVKVTSNIWPLVCPLEDKPDKYIVYNSELDEAAYFADDQEQEWIQNMQIHLYKRDDYMEERKKIRRLLKSIGFTVTHIYSDYETSTKYYHLCFECHIEEEDFNGV